VSTQSIEEINPPVECAETNCDRWVVPYSPGSEAEIVGWAELKAVRTARRKGGGLNKVGDWHETGRHRCATCARNLKATGHATQGRLL
jgi:hypothetical protein